MSSLNLKASASNVRTKQEINDIGLTYGNALNTKADESTSYTITEINTFLAKQYTFTAPLTRTVDTTTGIFTIGLYIH